MSITIYEKNTGKIKYFVEADSIHIKATKDNLLDPWVEGVWDWQKYYVKNGKATLRKKNPCQVDGHKLFNVPVASDIWINEGKYCCDENTVELEFDQPGSYSIRVESWPYLDTEFEIEN